MFRRFPLRDPERTELRLMVVKIDMNTLLAKLRARACVCGAHFSEDDYHGRRGAARIKSEEARLCHHRLS